eukprot:CAMPEP_0174254612 /NCGR_PEP_ID=MMETSP0439-20130205/3936_1 /TAXON_ID=0 /ORGANISM="Stereomyxa ramosa, Strain Chinc5" /LENGTH=381 /DNA_ID=CAMNT_0015336307 /DNA_START=29 /DNA_END=1174 /DNA_ORIENTATION=+
MKELRAVVVAMVGILCIGQVGAFGAFSQQQQQPQQEPEFSPNRILCPVLAAMYNGGDLHPDSNGSVTLEDIYAGLTDGMWTDPALADFQANGIADYNWQNKDTELHRDRCLPGTACWLQKKWDGKVTKETERWLNIFKMNGKETVEHGFSTGTRGGATNVPEFDYEGGPCNGSYPCEERFEKFYAACAEPDGRFYQKNVLCILCKAQAMGDRRGEFSFNSLQTGRQWQAIAAFTGWLAAFGRVKDGADPYGPATYFEMEDVRAMVMEGRYPDGWKKRKWGNMTQLAESVTMVLPCADKDGWYPPWWQNTTCPSATGKTCTPVIGSCSGGATCVGGTCICGLGSNNVSMCAQNGVCVERPNKCTYFGEPCTFIPADNPSAPF